MMTEPRPTVPVILGNGNEPHTLAEEEKKKTLSPDSKQNPGKVEGFRKVCPESMDRGRSSGDGCATSTRTSGH